MIARISARPGRKDWPYRSAPQAWHSGHAARPLAPALSSQGTVATTCRHCLSVGAWCLLPGTGSSSADGSWASSRIGVGGRLMGPLPRWVSSLARAEPAGGAPTRSGALLLAEVGAEIRKAPRSPAVAPGTHSRPTLMLACAPAIERLLLRAVRRRPCPTGRAREERTARLTATRGETRGTQSRAAGFMSESPLAGTRARREWIAPPAPPPARSAPHHTARGRADLP